MTDKLNIIGMVEKRDEFSTLTKALKQAGITDTLKGDGPFTLFAPTNEAFAAIPQDKLNDLMKPDNKEQLKNLLQYHVVPGKLMAKDFDKTKSPRTLHGQELKFDTANGYKINEAKVVTPDLEATNGVVMAIDRVLIPQVAAAASTPAR